MVLQVQSRTVCPAADQLAGRLRTLSEPMRIAILQQLREGEQSAATLATRLGTSRSKVRNHLRHLTANGCTSRRRDGRTVLYAVADSSVFRLCDLVRRSFRRRV